MTRYEEQDQPVYSDDDVVVILSYPWWWANKNTYDDKKRLILFRERQVLTTGIPIGAKGIVDHITKYITNDGKEIYSIRFEEYHQSWNMSTDMFRRSR